MSWFSSFTKEQRLQTAICLSLSFTIAEVVGGVYANSLSILSDAAHLLTDVASFGIALSALYLSRKPATNKYSFGYVRAEIIGALISVFSLWVLTGVLIVEAINRFYKWTQGNGEEVDGKLMTIIACFGVLINLVLATVFMQEHEEGAFHSHDHDHAEDDAHEHSHSHSSHNSHSTAHVEMNSNNNKSGSHQYRALESHDEESGHSHGGHNHGHGHGHGHGHEEHQSLVEKEACCDGHDHDHHDHHDSHDHSDGHSHAHGHGNSSHNRHVEKTPLLDQPLSDQSSSSSSGVVGMRDLNMNAAYAHVISDLIQSSGVVIGGMIIWVRPEWQVVDPICTFIFAGLVIKSTVSLITQVMEVLFEGVPRHINYDDVKAKLESLPLVVAVHDLHIWSLSSHLVSMSCHVHVEVEHVKLPSTSDDIIKSCNDVCQKAGIHHVTIQIEYNQNCPTQSNSHNHANCM